MHVFSCDCSYIFWDTLNRTVTWKEPKEIESKNLHLTPFLEAAIIIYVYSWYCQAGKQVFDSSTGQRNLGIILQTKFE